MIMAVGASKIGRGQRSDGSGHNEIDYSSLKMQFRSICIAYLAKLWA